MLNAQNSLLSLLSEPEVWEAFYEYKSSLSCPKAFLTELRDFIDRRGYESVCRGIAEGTRFALPKKSVISKMSTQKKRTVYTYPKAENTVLKLLTWLLLRRYDGLFADTLYSFRPGRTAKDAVLRLTHTPGIGGMYAYKADVSNYFNSVPVDMLVTDLRELLADDPALLAFLTSLLTEPCVLYGGREVPEQKGIMAGAPLSAFFANVFLRELDRSFCEKRVPYARYSDDIIVFAKNEAELEAPAGEIRAFLSLRGLALNPDKEERFSPQTGWVFLGFRYCGGQVDIAPASVKKLKQKMRRKARALTRWAKRNGIEGEKAARAFIRVFNRKLFENPADNELTWAYWFFPVITTAESLRALDRYAQDCVRFLVSGVRTKARYNVRYEDLKALGYKSLVHEYYAFKEKA